jgi:hypothetical protein
MFMYIFSDSAVQCATHMRSVFILFRTFISYITVQYSILLFPIIRAYFCWEDLSFILFPESIEYFIDGQALSPSYDLAPPSPISKLDRRHTGRLRKRDNLLTWGGGGRGAKSYDCEKALFFKSFNILCMRHMPRIKPETLERCAIFSYATAHNTNQTLFCI